MEKGTLKKVYWEKIENREYPFSQIADELTLMLLEDSQNEKYSSYNGNFQRSITLNELRRRLMGRGIKIPKPVELGRAVQSYLENNELRYEHQTRGSNGTVYRNIMFSKKKLTKIIERMREIMGEDSVLYAKPCLSS